jgi:hypothetical protein
MILKEGDKLLVAHRRLFETDECRFFVGCVDAYENGIVKATGRSFVRVVAGGRVIEKPEERTKILSLSSGTLMVYQLPESLPLEAVKFKAADSRLWLTDGKDFTMDLAESPRNGQVAKTAVGV